jgi:hypothetical protein
MSTGEEVGNANVSGARFRFAEQRLFSTRLGFSRGDLQAAIDKRL